MEEIKLLSDKLILSEVINYAYLGSKPDKYKRNQKAFAAWQSRIQAKILKLIGQKTYTIWDSFKKGKSKKI